MGSRSGDTCQTDMYISESFYTPNIVDLLLIVLEKQTKLQKLNILFRAGLKVGNFLAVLKTHWWPSVVNFLLFGWVVVS